MEDKNLTTYFMIPIVMVVIFLTIMFSLAIFSTPNYVLTIYGYEADIAYETYRAPKKGTEIYSAIERNTVNGYQFEGYYFSYNKETKEFSNKVPEDYKIKSHLTIYAKWVKI